MLAGLLGGIALFGSIAMACGGDDAPEETPTPVQTAPPLPTQTATAATQTEEAMPAETPTPEPTETPTPAPRPEGDEASAIAAAESALDARYLSPLNRDDCLLDNPDMQVCIEITGDEGSIASGIATFRAGDPQGGGFAFVMGLRDDGSWGFWFGTQQNAYQLLSLPGELLACGAGEGTVVRAEPSTDAAEVASVDDLASLSADGFVLTAEGGYQGGARGDGWYHVTAPAEGWVHSLETTDAALGDCLLHDAIEQTPRG